MNGKLWDFFDRLMAALIVTAGIGVVVLLWLGIVLFWRRL